MVQTAIRPAKEAAAVTFKKWDMAEYITDRESVVAHLDAALEEGDITFLLSVMGDIARSKGMTRVARELGISREGLYRSLAPGGNPSMDTVIKLLDLMGLRLTVAAKGA